MRMATVVMAFGALAVLTLPAKAADVMKTPALRDVRIQGYMAKKMMALIRERCTGEFARTEIFGEARRPFKDRDDDIVVDGESVGGYWRGEFWGKLMLSAARVADYLGDPEYVKWIDEECHRLIAFQDPDGYLGSYRDKDMIGVRKPDVLQKVAGYQPVWNLWGRKYAMWALLMAYKTTDDRALLDACCRMTDFELEQWKRTGLKFQQTGENEGLPSMSVLKPLVMLYEEVRNPAYLDHARRIVANWKGPDASIPAFFNHAKDERPLCSWYANPESWAKSYEMMSCLDGILEYYRVTGERDCLETVVAIRDNLDASERNPFHAVGWGDKFIGAAKYVNGLNEVCDIIHWIRLNIDLFLITGEDRYMDAVELAYYNGFLAGVFRKGDWGPFFIRSQGRHSYHKLCGVAYSQCCVNNLPRSYMDIASAMVTRDRNGTYHVNLFHDSTVTLDGVRFETMGEYPVNGCVRVKVSDPSAKVVFRKPAWCPRLDVEKTEDGYRLAFDMNPRLWERSFGDLSVNAKDRNFWPYQRFLDYWSWECNRDVQQYYRTTPAAQVMWGPLVLCKSCRTGMPFAEVSKSDTVYGLGYGVRVNPRSAEAATEASVWGVFDVELFREGAPTIRTTACDFQSGSDVPMGDQDSSTSYQFFSIWF